VLFYHDFIYLQCAFLSKVTNKKKKERKQEKEKKRKNKMKTKVNKKSIWNH